MLGNLPPETAMQDKPNFVLVPDLQPLVPIRFVSYADESDPRPYPVPSNLPIEGWPSQTGSPHCHRGCARYQRSSRHCPSQHEYRCAR